MKCSRFFQKKKMINLKIYSIALSLIIFCSSFCFAEKVKYPDDLKSSENFEQVMRLPIATIENAVNDSFSVYIAHDSGFIIDSDTLLLGFFCQSNEGNSKFSHGFAVFDSKNILIKVIQDSRFDFAYIIYFQGYPSSARWYITSDSSTTMQIDDKLNTHDITLKFTNLSEEILKSTSLNQTQKASKFAIDSYDIFMPDSLAYIYPGNFENFINPYLLTYNPRTKKLSEYLLGKYNIYSILQYPKYRKYMNYVNSIYFGSLNDQIVLRHIMSNLLFLVNYKTGTKEIYDLKNIAKDFKITGVRNYEEDASGFSVSVTNKNIYLIFEGDKEIVVLKKKDSIK